MNADVWNAAINGLMAVGALYCFALLAALLKKKTRKRRDRGGPQ